MKLSTKLFGSMGSLTAIIIVVGVFSLYQMNSVSDAANNMGKVSMPTIRCIEEINALTSDYRLMEVLHIYSEDVAELAQYDKGLADLWARIQDFRKMYEALPHSDAEKKQFAAMVQSLDTYKTMSTQTTDLSSALRTQEAITLLLTDSKKVYDGFVSQLATIVERNIARGERDAAEAEARFVSATKLVSGLLALGALFAIALSILIVRGVLGQLGKDPGELDTLAQKVAAGNLDIADDGKARGVYASILAMVKSLKENILNAQGESQRAREESVKAQEATKQAEMAGAEAQAKSSAILNAAARLEDVATIVSSASTQLAAQIEQSNRGASEQSARMEETATAMEEMNSTVMEVAKNAGSAYDVSGATRQKAEGGAQVVNKAVAGIRQVRADSLVLKDDMVTLSENAQNISQIMSVISDIADQTNLLALNAAIEAARAGDAGRGFAVVADEVRNLAEKTMASTTDVGNAIKLIQESASKSMKQVDLAVRNIEDATEFANESGASLEEIVKMVDQTADQVRSIAAASEEQSAASEEINHSISQVTTIAGETAQAMGEAAKAVSDLALQANNLATLIDEMKRI